MTHLYHKITGKGPDLVLLHGWGFNSEVWQVVISLLQSHFRITVLDLPGFGRSSWHVEHYHLEAITEAILPFLPQKAAYLGWSLGGLIATQIALNYPERVELLVNVCSTPCFLQKEDWPGISPAVFQKFIKFAKIKPARLLFDFLKMQFPLDESKTWFFQFLKESLFRFGEPPTTVLINSLICLKDADLRSAVRQLKVPFYYIFGTADVIVPFEITEKITNYIASDKIKSINSGHLPFFNLDPFFFSLLSQCLGLSPLIKKREALAQ